MDLAVLCDLRLASEHARFGQLFVKMGSMADVTGLWLLPRLIGHAAAARLLFTGEIIDAAEAHRIGLVSDVLPADELMPAARTLAGQIAASPPLGVGRPSRRLRGSSWWPLECYTRDRGAGNTRMRPTPPAR